MTTTDLHHVAFNREAALERHAIDHHAVVAARPRYPGLFGMQLVLAGFNPDRELVEPMLEPHAVTPPVLLLTPEAERQLRVGLGRVDMEIRWLAWLSERDELRLWRSWTGFEIYRARFERGTDGALSLAELLVESSPDPYHALHHEPARFTDTLRHVLALVIR